MTVASGSSSSWAGLESFCFFGCGKSSEEVPSSGVGLVGGSWAGRGFLVDFGATLISAPYDFLDFLSLQLKLTITEI